MKDNLQIQLETYCILQIWAKKQIAKDKLKTDKINVMSIKSVKQKL